eukprot:2155112-Pyramimonas_sp.AAC.1
MLLKSEPHQSTAATSPSWPASAYGASSGRSTCRGAIHAYARSAARHRAAPAPRTSGEATRTVRGRHGR